MRVSFIDLASFDVAPFDVTIRFFPYAFGRLTFQSTFDCTLLDRLRTDHPVTAGHVDQWHEHVVTRLDQIGEKVGQVLAPWFLGADYVSARPAASPRCSRRVEQILAENRSPPRFLD